MTHSRTFDRRALISGRLSTSERVVTPPGGEIASIIVQARAEHLDEIEATILAMPGCEIHGRDPRGKLIVVVEALDARALGEALTEMSRLPHVHATSLVFHAIDVG